MKIKMEVDFTKALKLIRQLSGPQIKTATAAALNDAAFEGRKIVQAEMSASFDGVTPYLKKSIQVEKATPESLVATVAPRYMGGKGVDPQNILRASIYGGQRKHKASEVAFARAGILPAGYSIVPGEQCPLDQYGNIKGGFMVQLISYFQAFGEQGYKANMTARRKANLAKAGRSAAGFKTINGVAYFLGHGKLRSGRGGNHLHPGIWSKTGTHGADVKPIIMFVKRPFYKARLDFFGKPIKAAIDKFNPRLRYRIRNILEGKS
ncbi:hypothetical protein [Rhodoferax ferrireducens]|uniref:hypothetical protein n=1 Tax=Rhodoferax ferrireducens TaxID=192843 RepID=UPI000E0CC892|nr:hypothetical protein [Rhodoferax ferrireducens]